MRKTRCDRTPAWFWFLWFVVMAISLTGAGATVAAAVMGAIWLYRHI